MKPKVMCLFFLATVTSLAIKMSYGRFWLTYGGMSESLAFDIGKLDSICIAGVCFAVFCAKIHCLGNLCGE